MMFSARKWRAGASALDRTESLACAPRGCRGSRLSKHSALDIRELRREAGANLLGNLVCRAERPDGGSDQERCHATQRHRQRDLRTARRTASSQGAPLRRVSRWARHQWRTHRRASATSRRDGLAASCPTRKRNQLNQALAATSASCADAKESSRAGSALRTLRRMRHFQSLRLSTGDDFRARRRSCASGTSRSSFACNETIGTVGRRAKRSSN